MQPYFAAFGISGAQWGILRVLQRAEGEGIRAVRLTDLSTRLLIRPPSVTGVVDRLQRLGLVERAESDRDLRVKRVRLTLAGRRLMERVLRRHPQQVHRVLAGLSDEEQARLYTLLLH